MESKVVVLGFDKRLVDMYGLDVVCKTDFKNYIIRQGELKGHHIVIRKVEDLVIGDVVKVQVMYERYRLDEEFYVSAKETHKASEHKPYNFTFDFNAREFNFTSDFMKDFFNMNGMNPEYFNS